MSKPIASLSLDLDNKWSYMKTHGDDGWDSFPSYLDTVAPRFLQFLDERELKITVFVVGQDAALEKNHDALRSIADAGHEIGNHSFHHEPWLHLYSDEELVEEFSTTEYHLKAVTGEHPVGFRGPGYSMSPSTLRLLAERGYEYDASTFPTFLGPVARAYYFFTARLSKKEKQERKQLFGKISEGFRPLKPYCWNTKAGPMPEIPVTTMPIFRVPIHFSYLLYLQEYSTWAARLYFRMALRLCQLRGIQPSLLLHPLDFLGCDDDKDLAFFPAMSSPAERKLKLLSDTVRMLTNRFNVVTMREHARQATASTLSRRSVLQA